MIAFLCSGCGKSLKVKDEFAGRSGRCPHCQQRMTVPSVVAAARERADQAGHDNYSETDAKTVLPPSLDSDRDPKTILPAVPRGKGNTGLKKNNTVHPNAPAVAGEGELYDFLAPPQAADEIGRLGNYRVLKVLGAGGMGVVFQAEDPKLNRLVALKAMLPALAASASNKERFLREARAAAAVEHDHIIPIFEVNEDRGVPFIAMPFLRGESLEDRLKKQRKLPQEETLRIAKECAEGLAAAHERNMIHRDIKPANIWLEGERGRVKILDFGLARSARGESNLTQQGAIIGTPAYMAPEQGAGKEVDTRCDLFSLGVVLYRLATGTLPFKGADTVSTLVAVATETPKAPRKLNPELSPRFSKLIMDLLAKSPEDRPPSALSVVDLLDEIEKDPAHEVTEISEEPVSRGQSVRADSYDGDTERGRAYDDASEAPAKRSPLLPLLVGVGVVGLLLVVGGIIILVVLLKKDDKPEVAQKQEPVAENFRPQPQPVTPNRQPMKPNPPPAIDTNKEVGNNIGDGKDGGGGVADRLGERAKKRPKANDANEAAKTYKPYTFKVKGILFAPDSKHFVSYADNKARVDYWDLETGKITHTFDLGANVSRCLLSSDGSRLIAYNAGRLLCWDVEGGNLLVTVTAPPGSTIVGGGFTADKDVRAALNVRVPTGAAVYIYDHGISGVLPVLDPKTKKPVIDKRTKQAVWQPFPHESEVERVFFSPDAKRFVSWSKDHMFRSFDIEKLKLTKFPVSPGAAKDISVSTDFKRIMVSFGHEFHIYDVEAGTEVKELQPEGIGDTDALAFGGESNIGVTARFGGPTCVYDLDEGTVKKEVKGIPFTSAIALSPDGKTILCGDISGKIHVSTLKE